VPKGEKMFNRKVKMIFGWGGWTWFFVSCVVAAASYLITIALVDSGKNDFFIMITATITGITAILSFALFCIFVVDLNFRWFEIEALKKGRAAIQNRDGEICKRKLVKALKDKEGIRGALVNTFQYLWGLWDKGFDYEEILDIVNQDFSAGQFRFLTLSFEYNHDKEAWFVRYTLQRKDAEEGWVDFTDQSIDKAIYI
jgi:hypothetical protein